MSENLFTDLPEILLTLPNLKEHDLNYEVSTASMDCLDPETELLPCPMIKREYLRPSATGVDSWGRRKEKGSHL